MSRPATVSAAIPTYGRDRVLIDTVEQLLALSRPPDEILVLDQTPVHDEATESRLTAMHASGAIRWKRIAQPSQPAALNEGLRMARGDVVLMLDDDIQIATDFVARHASNYEDETIVAVAGQVLQPEESPLDRSVPSDSTNPLADLNFPFRSSRRTRVTNAMSGNLSVRREQAIRVGGFDENFGPPVSYRFDAEFCKRLCRGGGVIVFDPSASIRHLRYPRGGTRSLGDHKRSASPAHGVGDYYFAFRQGINIATLRHVLIRPFREVTTRFHAVRPWWIPVKMIGELRALALAVALWRRGPRYIQLEADAGRSAAGRSRRTEMRGTVEP
jgi:glycosyltransferase involved in cell wall biosynthesis